MLFNSLKFLVFFPAVVILYYLLPKKARNLWLLAASLFAKKNGVEFVGIPAKTSRFSQKVNHFMREVAGVWHYILLGGNYHD